MTVKYRGQYIVISHEGIIGTVQAAYTARDHQLHSRTAHWQLDQSIDQLYKLLGGSPEVYSQTKLAATVWLNGNGRLIGLAVNPIATLYWDHYIVGTVLIAKNNRYADGFDQTGVSRIMAALEPKLRELHGISDGEINRKCRAIYEKEMEYWAKHQ